MSELKRLTPQQSRKANALIKKTCCNCMGGNCILLDDGDECVCPQLISYSLLCRWFQNAVLPADKLLYAELYQAEDRRRCAECGAAFASTSNSVKYCRTAASGSPAGKPPSGCGNDAPALRSRREKALAPCRFSDAI